jgi:pyruvate dehydrogenase E2 component (dihydrolipoamide acetyltransferase)
MSIEILMPALSPTMEEGKLAKWLVKEGDEVHSGDILAEIETDKATMEFEAVDEGRIGKLLVPEGAEGIKVNQPIAMLIADGESEGPRAPLDITSAMASIRDAIGPVPATSAPAAASAKKPPVTAAKQSPPPQVVPRVAPQTEPKTPAPLAARRAEAGPRIFASPLARRIAQQRGVDIASLRGSGPRGRVVRADVESARPGTVSRPAPVATATSQTLAGGVALPGIAPLPDARVFFKPEDYKEVPHDSMRKAIARRLSSAKTLIPHFYLTVSCRIDNLLATRARLNEAGKGDGGFKLSVNDFVVKAAALALMRVPEVNASWTDNAILRHKHADIGVAVALDFGLITPIVFRAEEKGLALISSEVKSLAERARAKKLKPMEFEGGSFAISNLGMYGIESFTAVINPPHAAILAVGAGEKRVIAEGDKPVVATVMSVTMSCDHRVIDGATGARFLQAFKQFVEEPAAMLL